MNTRLKESEEYYSQFPEEQIKTIPCPSCDCPVKSRFPDNDEDTWDTLVICPHCDSSLWKVVTSEKLTLELLG